MGRRNVTVVGLTFMIASCLGSTEKPADIPSESATLLSPTSVVQATVDGTRIFGAQVELAHDQNSMRGRGPLGVVDLRIESASLHGVVGGGPTELYLERDGDDGFSLRGLFSGVLGDLEVRSDRIQGQLGRCQYNLRRHHSDEGAAYNGQRVCGRQWMEPTTFTLSPGLTSLEPIDRAALIAVLLGR